ncbi:alpha/beta hydrolase [Mariniphaga sediminis]|uniref:alpha/beta hydrolase n=1 Tax=Mariniphaga sediminis TaxID=1628158 RepID=UPI00356ABED3
MKRFYFFLFFFLGVTVYAQEKDTIYLWPENREGIEKKNPTLLPDRGDNANRLTDVTNPAIIAFHPQVPATHGMGVIVCPGGSYRHLSIDKEGYDVAEWLNRLGITAFVLQYSVPHKKDQALMDIRRAIRIVRSKADQWGLDTQKIGAMGFSAGGNLSAHTLSIPSENTYSFIDSADRFSSVPDFAVLIYPGELHTDTEKLSFPDPVETEYPNIFMFCTADDDISNIGCLTLSRKLFETGIPCELHIMPHGGHGYGMRPGNVAAETWPALVEKWLAQINR